MIDTPEATAVAKPVNQLRLGGGWLEELTDGAWARIESLFPSAGRGAAVA